MSTSASRRLVANVWRNICGVMCNSIIKNVLSKRYEVYFAEPAMSADNAVGIAALALRAFKAREL